MPGTIFINNGNLLLGQILATFFAGMCTTQSFHYLTHFGNDPLWMRLFIGLMMSLFLYATVAAQSYSLYFTLILNAGIESPHYPPSAIFINSTVILQGNLFFIRRGYMVWKQPFVWAILTLGALAAFAMGIHGGYLAIRVNDAKSIPEAISLIADMINSINVGTGLLVATDVLIAMVLVYKLLETRRESGGFSKNTETVLTMLMKIAVGTSSLSAFLSIFILVCLKTQPLGVTYHLILSSSQGAVSVACVLYALNSREKLRAITASANHNIKDLSSNGTDRRGIFTNGSNAKTGSEVQGISIHLETFVREEQHNPTGSGRSHSVEEKV